MIASEAGVDPSLVMHYFGTKADLFAASVDLPLAPSVEVPALSNDPSHLGEAILRKTLRVWENPDHRSAWLALLRSATSDAGAARMLREYITSSILTPLADALDTPDADMRVALASCQIVGLGLTRYAIEVEPLASASDDEVVALLAPALQQTLTGKPDPV